MSAVAKRADRYAFRVSDPPDGIGRCHEAVIVTVVMVDDGLVGVWDES